MDRNIFLGMLSLLFTGAIVTVADEAKAGCVLDAKMPKIVEEHYRRLECWPGARCFSDGKEAGNQRIQLKTEATVRQLTRQCAANPEKYFCDLNNDLKRNMSVYDWHLKPGTRVCEWK